MRTRIDGDENIASGRDTIINNVSEDKQEYGVITDIFDFVLKKYKEENYEIDTESSSVRDKLIHIKKKVELNFSDADEQKEVKQYFNKLYTKINFVEKAFQTLDSEEQSDIHYYVLNNYNKIKNESKDVTQIQILYRLTDFFIPENSIKNPTYRSIAQSIVLFFFDDCTIFEKTSNESQQTSLFDLI
ncbi:hypothetical protein [Kordia sp.]|uniref:hypothetical protein n=1 Tax=Kordia sp. TaxID=1965332 RepID=UPI003B5B2F8B